MHDRRRAQTIVEFALILPVFMLLVAGTIEFGRAFFSYGLLLQAAQEGARYGAVLGHAKVDSDIVSRVQQVAAAGGITLSSSNVTVSGTKSPTDSTAVSASGRIRGTVLQVTVSYTHSVLIPFVPFASLGLTARSSMVVEYTV